MILPYIVSINIITITMPYENDPRAKLKTLTVIAVIGCIGGDYFVHQVHCPNENARNASWCHPGEQ